LERGRPSPGTAPRFVLYSSSDLALVCLPAGLTPLFSIEDAAGLTGVHPEMLRYYRRLGLLGGHVLGPETEPAFDADALDEVRRIEHYRRDLGVRRRALSLVCDLWRACEERHIEISFLRPGRGGMARGD
jgi:hypothetical protein